MRNSAEHLGGYDPLTTWLTSYLLERLLLGIFIPSLVHGVKIMSNKWQHMPIIRIVFHSGISRDFLIDPFFLNIKQNKTINIIGYSKLPKIELIKV